MELESFEDGTLLHIGVEESDSVPVDGVIAIIGEEGEDIKDLLKDIESGGSSGNDKEEASDASDNEKEDSGDSSDESEDESVDASDVAANVILMPKMSDTMEEGVIASWLKKCRRQSRIGREDILAEVETDKATMELESYEDGTLLHIGVDEGGSVPVDGVIAVIGEEGADFEKLLKARSGKQKKEKQPAKDTEGKQPEATSQEPSKEDKSEKDASCLMLLADQPTVPAATHSRMDVSKLRPSPRRWPKRKATIWLASRGQVKMGAL